MQNQIHRERELKLMFEKKFDEKSRILVLRENEVVFLKEEKKKILEDFGILKKKFKNCNSDLIDEEDFLKNENKILKNRLDEILKKNIELEKKNLVIQKNFEGLKQKSENSIFFEKEKNDKILEEKKKKYFLLKEKFQNLLENHKEIDLLKKNYYTKLKEEEKKNVKLEKNIFFIEKNFEEIKKENNFLRLDRGKKDKEFFKKTRNLKKIIKEKNFVIENYKNSKNCVKKKKEDLNVSWSDQEIVNAQPNLFGK